MKQEIKNIANWMKQSVYEAHAKGVVLGLSGGVDSAVVAGIAKQAFGNEVLGIIMPIESDPQDAEDARLVADALDLRIESVDLTETYKTLIEASFNSKNSLAKSNIKPRLRMTTLYYYGQSLNYLVCGNSNASEYYIGYFTKYGDSGSDLMPIVSYTKDEIYEMAKELNIPNRVIQKIPTAGLLEGQTDEDDMGFSYKELNELINDQKRGPNYHQIMKMHKNSEHKRKYAKQYKR